MGQRKGCVQKGNVGRPKGRKDTQPRVMIHHQQGTEDIRMAIAEAFREHQDKIIPRIFVELNSLEGYAYLSGLKIIVQQFLPALQSIELNATMEKKESFLLERIQSLRLNAS